MDAKTIAIALRLEANQFTAGLGMAAGRVKAFGNDVQAAARKAGQGFQDAASASDKHLKKIGTVGLIAGGAVVAGLGLAAAASLSFDKQMSEVGAVAGATGSQLGDLRQAAIDAGQATVFSASQAAQAEAELAKAGVSTQDILAGGLTGALNLASAGSLDLATSAELAANAMNIFKLQGSDVPHISDVLAAAANKSATDVGEMGLALKQGGLVANQYGITLEETAGSLALFAQNGLKGSDAGTSFKTMLQRLVPQSTEARDLMDQMGISFFDATGKFVGLSSVAQILQDKLGGLSDEQRNAALQTLFGSDAVRGATILMEGGSAAVDQWTASVNEQGYAADLAAKKNDNLAGDLEQLRGSIETALIQGGSVATGVLRGLVSTTTDLVNGFGQMPAPLQGTFVGLTAVAGVGASAVGIYGTLAPKIREAVEALKGMGSLGQMVASNMLTIGLAAGVVGAAMIGLTAIYADAARRQSEVDAGAKEYAAALNSQTGALEDNVNAVTAKKFAEGDMAKLLKDTNANYRALSEGIKTNASQLDHWRELVKDPSGLQIMGKELREAADGGDAFAGELLRLQGVMSEGDFGDLIRELEVISTSYKDGNISADAYRESLAGLGVSADGAAAASNGVASETAGVGDAFDDTAKKIKDAVNALKDWYDQTTAGLSAQIDYEDSLDKITGSVKENGHTLDLGTEAGRKNAQTFIDAKDAIVAYGIEVYNTTGSTDAATYATNNLVGSLVSTMQQAGYTDEQINTYLDTLGLTPEDIATQFNTPGLQAAKTDVENYRGGLLSVPTDINTTVNVYTATAFSQLDELINKAYSVNAALGNATLGAAMSRQTYIGLDGKTHLKADGGIVDFYANGGMREDHTAQIVPAGSWRVFGEPETGGEAYIPLAASKRPRSMAVLGAVANRFGIGGGGNQFSIPVSIDARGASASDARAIEAAVQRGITQATDQIARNLEKRERKLS